MVECGKRKGAERLTRLRRVDGWVDGRGVALRCNGMGHEKAGRSNPPLILFISL